MKNNSTLVQNKVLGGGLLLTNSKPSGFSCALMR